MGKQATKAFKDRGAFKSGDFFSVVDPLGAQVDKTFGTETFRKLSDPAGVTVLAKESPTAKKARVERETIDVKIEKQAQKERSLLAEAKDDVAKRKIAAESGKSGRRSLIATSPTGTRSTNLGGTA